MRYDSTHKEKTRRRVLSAAAQAIRGDGPDRIGVAGVMAEAGLTHGGFYAHFASKGELITATIEHMFEGAAARLQREIDAHPPREALAAYIASYLSMTHCTARDRGCPVAALASDLPRLEEATRLQFAAGTRRLREKLADLFARAGITDPRATAQSVHSEMVGALALARMETDRRRAGAILAASRRALADRLGLAGMA